VVIQVDEWAVYAPNMVFYFDTQMDNKRIETLKRAAGQLRNRKALITYSSSADPNQNQRALLLDIAPAGQKSKSETTARETAKPPGKMEETAPRKLSEEKAAPSGIPAGERTPEQAPLKEADRGRKSGQTGPITSEEVTEFVSRLLYLNGRKDPAAVAPFYADNVDYYDRGVISRDKVLEDLKYYYRNWIEIDTRLDSDVLMTGFEPEVRIVKFRSTFSVKNQVRSLAGTTENIWIIKRINGDLKLIDVKEKILR
jgi:hypothetical protein